MRDYKDLNVWQKSMDLVIDTYTLVKLLPKEETYALSVQIRRAVVSIPSNIAEESNRNTSKEFIQFLYIALGSASEVETQLIIANRLGYINNIQNELNRITKEEKNELVEKFHRFDKLKHSTVSPKFFTQGHFLRSILNGEAA